MRLLTAVLLSLLLIPLISAPAYAEICGVFHKKINDVCVHFNVPSNAHLTYSGNSWDCNRGFKLDSEGQNCEEIKIPDNASANLIGSFYCNSGFERAGNKCRKVSDVENGKFYEMGSNFYCISGFNKNEETGECEKIKIPENARGDDSSLDGWRCFSGYIKEGDGCKEFKLPEHGFWFIDFWGCEPGYKKNFNDNSCQKISIPENAYGANTFDGWLCNPGYTKNYRDEKCDLVR